MEQITIFKAFDGTLFDTEEECLEYEGQNYPSDDGLKYIYLWDENMRPIVLDTDGIFSYAILYERTHWFILKKINNSSVECITRILETGHYPYPEEFIEGDVYAWSKDGWYNYSAEFREIKDNLEIIHGSII